jgi:hypothetical protein
LYKNDRGGLILNSITNSSHQNDYIRYSKEIFHDNRNKIKSSHGSLSREGIAPVSTKAKDTAILDSVKGRRFLENHHKRLPSGINDAGNIKEERTNCAITSVAALLGKKSSEITNGDKQGPFFFSSRVSTGRLNQNYTTQKKV